MKVKKILVVSFVFAMAFAMIVSATGCRQKATAPAQPSVAVGSKPYIALISKGFQHQFWQTVRKGADQAAKDNDVTITFDGPPSESDVSIQVEMLKSAIARKPAAIGLAALDTQSVLDQLNECKSNNIPVIGFDSGVPNAPEGTIYATAATDSYAAAGMAAEHLFENPAFQAALKSGKHITVGVLSQDATSMSITSRTSGFIDTLDKKVEAVEGFAGAVEVVGHDKWKKAASVTPKLTVKLNIPATTGPSDMKTGAEFLLRTSDLVAIFGSNEGAVNGILTAANDGKEFNKVDGKYKNIIAIGFDAGKTQKVAVANGWLFGAITQDPYQIGYKSVSLAVDAINGKPAPPNGKVDTGCKWYDAKNMNDPDIALLLYD